MDIGVEKSLSGIVRTHDVLRGFVGSVLTSMLKGYELKWPDCVPTGDSNTYGSLPAESRVEIT